MDADELENILENLVRVGTVTDVDGAGQRVRVKFRDTGLTSDWLRVLQRTGEGLDIARTGSTPTRSSTPGPAAARPAPSPATATRGAQLRRGCPR